MSMLRLLLGVAFVVSLLTAAPASADVGKRFEAAFADGSRHEGDRLEEWQSAAAQPKLDGRPLMDAGNPLVWLRDRSKSPGEMPEEYVEMVGGDRLPGRALTYRAAGSYDETAMPAHFVVRASMPLHHPESQAREIRVVERFVWRIVWQSRGIAADRHEPGTAYCRDGREFKFRSARFDADAVRLLLEEGVRRLTFSELAAIDLPRPEGWTAYCDELALLGAKWQSPLHQVETTNGLRVTGSSSRFDARETSEGDGSDRWVHALQPGWSLSLLWIPHRAIFIHRFFAPHQPPLTRFLPSKAVMHGSLSRGSWPWQLNRNVQGGTLRSGGKAFGFGFGVHAYSELHFSVPTGAKSFRAQLGLDAVAGDGGCVRVRVFAGKTGDKPLFESDFLVGSAKTVGTGDIALGGLKPGEALILQVDPAHQGRPAGADPLDVRDACDWLEPVIEVDAAWLAAEVQKRLTLPLAAWEGWEVMLPKDGTIKLMDLRDDTLPERVAFQAGVLVEKEPLVLRRTFDIKPRDNYLLIAAQVRSEFSDKPKIQFRVDGEPLAEFVIPHGAAKQPSLMAFPVFWLQGKKVTIELAQTTGDQRLGVWWRDLKLVEYPPTFNCLFDEDAATVKAAVATNDKVKVVEGDAYSGKKAVKILPGGKLRFDFNPPIFPQAASDWDAHRLFRFAAKKVGGGRFCVEIERTKADGGPAAYDAGKGDPCVPNARRILGDELPNGWIVFARDVPPDFGDGPIRSITFSAPDGECLLVDQVLFARSHDDLPLLATDIPWQVTNAQSRDKAAETVKAKNTPWLAWIEIEGRKAQGVLYEGEGYVLTTADIVGKPGREAMVILGNGKRLKGTTAGLHRTKGLGLVKLSEVPQERGMDCRGWDNGMLTALFFTPGMEDNYDEAAPPAWLATTPRRGFQGTLWMDCEERSEVLGRPLVNHDGALIAIETRHCPFGGSLFTRVEWAGDEWNRLKNGEILGK